MTYGKALVRTLLRQKKELQIELDKCRGRMDCLDCDGHGERPPDDNENEEFPEEMITCPECDGAGWVNLKKSPCTECSIYVGECQNCNDSGEVFLHPLEVE